MDQAAREQAEDAFIDAMGRFLGSQGMPPMAGRILGWLLIAQPPEQTAAQVAERLGASRGAISGAARLLSHAGLIRRAGRRGDRREWLSVPPGSVSGLLAGYLPRLTAFRTLTEQGLELVSDLPPPAGAALHELHDFYAFMEREWTDMLARYAAYVRSTATEEGNG